MLNRDGYAAFCVGCEFSGNMPAGETMDRSLSRSHSESGVRQRFFLDREMRFSNGIVNTVTPEAEISPHAIEELVKECKGCDNCLLTKNNFVPVEIDDDTRARLIEQYLSKLRGIKELGTVSIERTE